MANIKKLLMTIENEVGYLEKNSTNNLQDKTAGAGSGNYTKYWEDLAPNMQGNPWCQAFVIDSFIKAYGLLEAKKLLNVSGSWSYYTPTAASYFQQKHQWFKYPKIGDIVYFKNSNRICHVGIVYNVDESKIYTIEGNTSSRNVLIANGGGVFKKQYPLTYSSIAGYGRPQYDDNTYAPVVPKQTIKKGTKGAAAAFLQQCLNFVNDAKLVEDGDFGTASEQALINWQMKKGLEADGIYGQNSMLTMSKEIK